MKFEQLSKQLKLNTLTETMQLQTLKDWCNEHISRDINYTDEACLASYTRLAQDFLELFIPSTDVNPAETKAELDNLTPIQYAAYRGFDRFIESSNPILKEDLNASNASGMTPLHLAGQFGHVHTVEALLAQGADLTKPNEFAELPIHVTLSSPSTEQLKANKEIIFRKLWQSNPKTLTYKDDEGNTTFHRLAGHGYDKLLSDVLDSNTKGAFYCNNYSQYPIHTAILGNQIHCAKRLLAIPGVATLADDKYRIAIHYAACFGTKKMMALCMEVSPDLNFSDTEGKTALILATEAGNHDATEVLANYEIPSADRPLRMK